MIIPSSFNLVPHRRSFIGSLFFYTFSVQTDGCFLRRMKERPRFSSAARSVLFGATAIRGKADFLPFAFPC